MRVQLAQLGIDVNQPGGTLPLAAVTAWGARLHLTEEALKVFLPGG